MARRSQKRIDFADVHGGVARILALGPDLAEPEPVDLDALSDLDDLDDLAALDGDATVLEAPAPEPPSVLYFPVKHYSPACAWHVDRLIRRLRPVAVLVEGPDDATELIPHLVHPETQPSLTVFSTYADTKNRYGQNGVLSPDETVPARFRSWWPMMAYSPEYVALIAGEAVGADLRFIDLPLLARIPFQHARRSDDTEVVDDGRLAQNAWFEAVRKKDRRRSFSEFWEARFEAGGFGVSSAQFMQSVLTFAWCARYAGDSMGLDDDGTLTREAHMRWHLDAARKAHPNGLIVVVTGAFHSVALPFTKRAKAKYKKDKSAETLVTAHSFAALARLYDMERLPGFTQAVWDAVQDAVTAGEAPERPADVAAMRLLVEIMRSGRAEKLGLSTADAVGAWKAAQNLARLRHNPQVTVFDLLDATQMGYVKGDRRLQGGNVERLTREALIGRRHGRVTAAAGEIPLRADFYASARKHRIDVSGLSKTVKLDLHKQQKHRFKSAFLHRCDFAQVPMFTGLEDNWGGRRAHYKGPDPVAGEDLHLITERWGVCWREEVDDRLIELSALGATLEQAAGELLRQQVVAAQDDAAAAANLLVRCAQMMLIAEFDGVLDTLESAIEADHAFVHLVDALTDCVLLQSHRDAMATQGLERLLRTIAHLFTKAAIVLPSVAGIDPSRQGDVLDRLTSLVRIALTFDAAGLDRAILIEKVDALVNDPDGQPAIRGAGFGVLYAFGAVRESAIAAELLGYLRGSPTRRLQAGAFLDGLFQNARSVLLRSPRLLVAINRVLGELDWPTFKTLLPDLRRAFTQFIPSELDAIAGKVSRTIGLVEVEDDAPIDAATVRLAADADARVSAALADWI